MTLKGMRKADQQVILDSLGMDRASATRTEGAGASVTVANIPKFEANTRLVFGHLGHLWQLPCGVPS